MPVAAVPRYLGNDFSSASPALRFGVFLPIWIARADQEQEVRDGASRRSSEGRRLKQTIESRGIAATIEDLLQRGRLPDLWEKSDAGSRESWKKVITLTPHDRDRMTALAARYETLFHCASASSNTMELIATSVAPFATGLGNEHPLENGFAFLNPYGLPYLPGSGVKGVARRAAEELAHRDYFGSGVWTLPAIWHLFGFEPCLKPEGSAEQAAWDEWVSGFSVSTAEIEGYLIAVLDDTSEPSRKLKQRILAASDPFRALLQQRELSVRGALEFWDVIPEINDNDLTVEIMTPHQSHYYRNDAYHGSTAPHDSGRPTPIHFLAVPPNTGFTFHVRCNHHRLSRCGPEVDNGRWRILLEAAFEHAFEWLGFGAKTAVGYGAMKRDHTREDRAHRESAERKRTRRNAREREERLSALSPIGREIEETLDSRQNKNVPEISAIIQEVRSNRWTGMAKVEVARWLESRMKHERRWKEQSGKKNPQKDRDHRHTLLVKLWLSGE